MKKAVLWVLIIVIVLSFLLTFLLPQDIAAPTTIPNPTTDPVTRNDAVDTEKSLDDQIVVTSPLQNTLVSSPFTIKGKARGSWYSEAVFPVELVDAKTGLEIAKGIAHAEGEWMTDNFVPFSIELKFTSPPKATAANLILKKDNPSGLPENDASLSIPVTVK